MFKVIRSQRPLENGTKWPFREYIPKRRSQGEERRLTRNHNEPIVDELAKDGYADAEVFVPGTIYTWPDGPESFNPDHGFAPRLNEPLDSQTQKVDDTKINPMGSIQRTFDGVGFMDYGNAYFTIANGFMSGGITDTLDIETQQISEYDPEEVWNYEFGFKMDAWDRKLRLNTAVFYTDYEDRQLTSVRLNPQTGRPQAALINAESSWIAGVELEAIVIPVDNLQITANVTFNDSDIEDYEDERITSAVEGPVPEGCARINVSGIGDLDSCPIDRSDEGLPRLPDSVYFLAVQYTFDTEWGEVVPMVSWSYRTSLDNCFDYASCLSGKYKVDQTDVSARLTWNSPDFNWRVTAYGNNLTDDRYISGGTPLVDVTETAGTVYNPPRTYGIEAAYTW